MKIGLPYVPEIRQIGHFTTNSNCSNGQAWNKLDAMEHVFVNYIYILIYI